VDAAFERGTNGSIMNPTFSTSKFSMMLPTMVATAILVVGVVDDLRTRKFHNWLFLVCLGIAAVAVFISGGLEAFPLALLGLLAGFAIFLPLVLMKIIGAGDMKLMAAFGFAAGWDGVLYVAVYGLFWAAFFGVLTTLFQGQGRVLVSNLISIVTLRERKGLTLHKIPFTVAIFMGWLTQLVFRGAL
jgi:Flp pilus assembly protein protease CpaA